MAKSFKASNTYRPQDQLKQPSKLLVYGGIAGLTSAGFYLDGMAIYDKEFCEEVPTIPSLVTFAGFQPRILTTLLQISDASFNILYGAMYGSSAKSHLGFVDIKQAYPGMVISGNPSYVKDLAIVPRRGMAGVWVYLKNCFISEMEFIRFSVRDRMVFKVSFEPTLSKDIDEEIFAIDYKKA